MVQRKQTKRGRPSKRPADIAEQARRYISTRRDRYDETSGKFDVDLPTVEGFALYLQVNRDTLYSWAKHSQDAWRALEHIKQEQQKRLINKGLGGKYNPTIVKLMLMNNHDMKEKTQEDTCGWVHMSNDMLDRIYEKADEIEKEQWERRRRKASVQIDD